ncbi:hypothetical protein ScPMuIL_014753 [Solemya velum]
MAEKQPVRPRHLNFVHNDEIWKDHVRHESVSQRMRWPDRWGYLVDEYKHMNLSLQGELACIPPVPASSISRKPTPVAKDRHPINLPLIPPTPPRTRQSAFPKTTTAEIGFLAADPNAQLEKYGRYGPKSRGQVGF